MYRLADLLIVQDVSVSEVCLDYQTSLILPYSHFCSNIVLYAF